MISTGHRDDVDSQPAAFGSRWVDRAFTLAVQLQQAGNHDQARQLYIRILEQHPCHSDAMYFLASIAAQSGDLNLGADLLGQAIAIAPKPPYFVLLGNIAQNAGDLDVSEHWYRQALALDRRCTDALYNLGNTLVRLGRTQEAIGAFENTVAAAPQHVEALNNLALQYRNAGREPEAIRILEQAIQLRPQAMPLHLNLGNAYQASGNHTKALASFDRAVALSPDFAYAHNNRGNALRSLGRLEDAADAYDHASALAPHIAEVYANKGNVCLTAGRTSDAIDCFRRAITLENCSPMAYSSAIFTFHYDPAVSPAELATLHRRWGERYGNTPPMTHRNRPDPDRRLRIGYVSADFRRHPVAMFTAPVLAAHDRSQVEVFAYYNNSIHDEWTETSRAASDHWLEVPGWSDIELARRIQSDSIDILVDLAGHTAGNRLLTFARKPSPVQVTWLGYFNTTGLDTIDYILVDSVLQSASNSSYSETPYPLDGCYLCYQVPAGAQPATQTPAATRGFITYGCFNALAKITGEVVRLWSRILDADPMARLVLRNAGLSDASARARFRQVFEENAIDPARIDLLGACPHPDLLAAYADIDIALDPFPYNGGTTTCEALSMGVPVVTLAGDRFVSRVGATILQAAGHPEWVASDPEQYLRIALSLRDRVVQLRPSLARQVAGSPLAAVGPFAASLENAYRTMWRKWCDAVRV